MFHDARRRKEEATARKEEAIARKAETDNITSNAAEGLQLRQNRIIIKNSVSKRLEDNRSGIFPTYLL